MRRKNCRLLLLLGAGLSFALLPAHSQSAPLVVHEWGTFTSLQDETGQAIGGINTDDEPVPPFVHQLAGLLLLRPTELPGFFSKGTPRCHPDITMRLETPVLYFHPPPGQPTFQGVSVSAAFRGGWLSEFYPNAEAQAPGMGSNYMAFGPLRANTVGTLAWNNLEVGGDWSGPETSEHVWTSPRAVHAAAVRTADGEAERFLFYRGVAHIDAPIAISQDTKAAELVLRSQCPAEIAGRGPLAVKSLWLVDIAASGRVAFRVLPPVALEGEEKTLARVSSHFGWWDYSAANREKLRTSLHDALVGEGLFDDEAQALLNTWEVSYFKSAGMRVFFLVPRPWTDFYLPLNVSAPAEITRVMVGRIELVTSEQRNSLRQIAQFSTNNIAADATRLMASFASRMTNQTSLRATSHSGNGMEPTALNEVFAGTRSLKAYGVSVPESYRLYLALGRFRNALILEEARNCPTPGLAGFISTYRLEGYRPLEISSAGPLKFE